MSNVNRLGKYIFIASCTIPLLGNFSSISIFEVFSLNQLSYVIAIVPIVLYLLMGKINPIGVLTFLAIVCVPGLYNYIFGSAFDFNSLFRFVVSFIPVMLWKRIYIFLAGCKFVDIYLILYKVGILVAVIWAMLQVFGILPFYDFDYVDGIKVGRASGGYEKPVIFTIVLFPIFLYASVIYDKNRLWSAILFMLLILIIWLTGLRTALISYLALLIIFFLKNISLRLTLFLVKWHAILLIGVFLIVVLYILKEEVPLLGLLRGRLGMWVAHVHEMTSGGILQFLFGKSGTVLNANNQLYFDVYSFSEVHNDYLRIFVVHGVFGLIVVSYIFRNFLIGLYKCMLSSSTVHLHLLSSYVIFLLLFMVTNEPTYYPAVIWITTTSLIYFSNYAVVIRANHSTSRVALTLDA